MQIPEEGKTEAKRKSFASNLQFYRATLQANAGADDDRIRPGPQASAVSAKSEAACAVRSPERAHEGYKRSRAAGGRRQGALL